LNSQFVKILTTRKNNEASGYSKCLNEIFLNVRTKTKGAILPQRERCHPGRSQAEIRDPERVNCSNLKIGFCPSDPSGSDRSGEMFNPQTLFLNVDH
jgi:hypothetical protein